MNRATLKRNKLREGLKAFTPIVAVGAHDALSARLVEEYGFDAIWASGFGISTMTYAMPDINLITMSEALDAAVNMDNATNLPVIADCDNGFGGLLNVTRTVREYERAGIAGICVEDNLFPKRNSLYNGKCVRELITTKEQVRRIQAAKDVQETEEFVFIARTEALIAGHGIDEACRRADAYLGAGADAILIHSRDKTLSEIDGFLGRWRNKGKIPLVAVPTLFPDFTAEQLYERGFQMIILANQLMRAAVKAMEETLLILREEGNTASVESRIAAVNHLFDLVQMKQFIELEDRFGEA